MVKSNFAEIVPFLKDLRAFSPFDWQFDGFDLPWF